MKDNFFSSIKGKISIGRLSLTILMLLIVVLGGTFAWLTFQSNQSALVLTIGEVNDAQITLTPYQITGTVTPVTGYTDGTYSDVIIEKGTGNSTLLYYKINQLDTALRNVLQYKVVCGTDYKEVKTGYFKDFTSNTEYAVIWDENTELSAALSATTPTTYQSNLLSSTCTNNGTNSSVNYRVYTWVDSSEGNQSAIQGSELDMELNGSIGSVTITGSNVYNQTLTASITDYSSANNPTYSYQWYYNTTNSTSGGTAISGATSQSYKIGSGLAGKYIYVVVTVSEMGYTQRTYVDITDTTNNTYADVEKANSTISTNSITVTYPKGSASIAYTGDGAATCGLNGNGSTISSCGVDSKTVSLQLKNIPESGTTTIKISLAEGTDYKATSKDITVNISKGTLSGGTVTISGTNQYKQTLTAKVTAAVTAPNDLNSTAVDSYSYQWYSNSSNSASGGTAINGATSSTYTVGTGLVGKYIYVVVTAHKEYYNDRSINDLTDSSNTSATVLPITGTISLSSKSATYTGSAISANTPTTNIESPTYTYTYYTDSTCSTKTPTSTGASSAGAAPIDAGTYYVKVTAESSNGDYTSATTTCTSDSNIPHIITPATVAVTWSGTSKTYNGSEQKPTATASGLGNDSITMTVSGGQTNYSSSSYTATATCSSVKRSSSTVTNGCNNYLFTDTDETTGSTKVTTTFTIAKYSPKFSVGSTASSIDIGKGSSFTATVTTQSYCSGAINVTRNNTNVGVSSSAANYAESLSITGITSSGSKTIYFKDTNDSDNVIGATILTVGFTPTDTANCSTPATKTHTVTVVKRTPNVSLEAHSDTALIYNGSTQAANTATATYDTDSDGDEDSISLSYTYTYYTNSSCTTKTTTSVAASAGGAPYDAGTYYVKATSTATGQYNSASSSCVKHKINPYSVSVTWNTSQTSFTYSGSGQAPALTSTTVSGVNSEIINLSTTKTTVVGTNYTSTASCSSVTNGRAKCGNYTLSGATSHKFAITKYTPTITLGATSGSVNVFATSSFNATPTTLSVCQGTLKATSANKSYVTLASASSGTYGESVSFSNVTSGTTKSIYLKGVGYSAGTNITVEYIPSDTTNCNSATSKIYSASVSRVTPTISLSNKTATYSGSAISANAATATYNGSSISLSYSYTYYNGSSCSGTALSGAPTNVGSYSVKATSSQTSQYNSATSGCATLTINKYYPSFYLSNTSGTIMVGETGSFNVPVTTIAACEVSIQAVSGNTEVVLVSESSTGEFADEAIFNKITSSKTVSFYYEGQQPYVSDVGIDIDVIMSVTDTDNCGADEYKTFTVEEVGYDITYYNSPDGGEVVDATSTTHTVQSLSSLGFSVSSTDSNNGWEFYGWTNVTSGTNALASVYDVGDSVSLTGTSLDLYAVYRRQIIFKSGDPLAEHTSSSSHYQYYNTYNEMLSNITTDSLKEIDGFNAVGWIDSDDNTYGQDGEYGVPFDVDEVLVGKYEGGTSGTATFHYLDSSCVSQSTTAPITYYDGTYSIVTPKLNDLSDYSALGWRDDGSASYEEFDADVTIESNYTDFYAVYSKDIKFYELGDTENSPTEISSLYLNAAGNYKVNFPSDANFELIDEGPIGFSVDENSTKLSYGEDSFDATYSGSFSSGSCPTIPDKLYLITHNLVKFYDAEDLSDYQEVQQLYNGYSDIYSLVAPTDVKGGNKSYGINIDSSLDACRYIDSGSVDGGDLLGWTTSDSSTEVSINSGSTYTGSENEFYAIFSFNARFYSGLEETSDPGYASATVYYNASNYYSVTVPSSPGTANGYEFLGWNYDLPSSNWTEVYGDTRYVSAGSVTNGSNSSCGLIEWQAVYNGTITLHNGLSGDGANAVDIELSTLGAITASIGSLPAPASVTGYNVEGWSSSSTGTSASFVEGDSYISYSEGGSNLYAIYSKDITFYYGAAQASSTTQKRYYSASGTTSTLTTPSSIGSLNSKWSSVGWTSATTASSSTSYVNPGSATSSSSATFYALYKRTLTFVGGYYESAKSVTLDQYYNSYGTTETVTFPESSTLESNGYSLTNWTLYGYRRDNTLGYKHYSFGEQLAYNYGYSNTLRVEYWRYNGINLVYQGNGGSLVDSSATTSSLKRVFYNGLDDDVWIPEVTLEGDDFYQLDCMVYNKWELVETGETYNVGEYENLISKFSTNATSNYYTYLQPVWEQPTSTTLSLTPQFEDGTAYDGSWTNQNVILKLSYCPIVDSSGNELDPLNNITWEEDGAVQDSNVADYCQNEDSAKACEILYQYNFQDEVCFVPSGSVITNSVCADVKIDKTPPTCTISSMTGGYMKLTPSDSGGSDISCAALVSSSVASGPISECNDYTTDHLDSEICYNTSKYYGYVLDVAGNDNQCMIYYPTCS